MTNEIKYFHEPAGVKLKKVIFLRGPYGAGKSKLAVEIMKREDAHPDHLCSADQYFIRGGMFNFDPRFIRSADTFARGYANAWMRIGVRTIVVDCPNLCVNHMGTWMSVAKMYGYIWAQAIPETPGTRNADGNWNIDVLKANTHPTVPIEIIERQIADWEEIPNILTYDTREFYTPEYQSKQLR
jgi:hypothetical protein